MSEASMPRDSSLIPGAALRRVSVILRFVQGAAVLVALMGIVRLRHLAATVPPILAFSADHRAISGSPVPFSLSDERFSAFAVDVAEAALTRNEAGMPPEISHFATRDCLAKLQGQIKQGHNSKGVVFSQSFRVYEQDGVRIVSGNAVFARIMFRGITTVHSAEKSASSDFYWGAVFVAGPRDEYNALGWRLSDLFEISAADYYEKDTNSAAAKAVAIPAPHPTSQ